MMVVWVAWQRLTILGGGAVCGGMGIALGNNKKGNKQTFNTLKLPQLAKYPASGLQMQEQNVSNLRFNYDAVPMFNFTAVIHKEEVKIPSII